MNAGAPTYQITDISTVGYAEHYRAAATDILSVLPDLATSEQSPTACNVLHMYKGNFIYAHKSAQEATIEYYTLPDDARFAADIAPETPPPPPNREIQSAVRDFLVSLYFSNTCAKARGEETKPLWVATNPWTFGLQFSARQAVIGKMLNAVRALFAQGRPVATEQQDEHDASLCQSLDTFENLEQGWDGYSAPKPSRIAIENAKALIHAAKGLRTLPERVEPSAMGGVGITFASEPREVVIEFYNKGTAHALFSDDDTGEMHTQAVPTDPDGYRRIIREVHTYLYG